MPRSRFLQIPWSRVLSQSAQCRFCGSATVNRSAKEALRVLFFGTDDFSLPHLQVLNRERLSKDGVVQSLEVVVPQSKRPVPVKSYCVEASLPCHAWPHVPSHGPFDVGVIASFGYLLPEKLISQFPRGMLNVHPSMLPRWRGAAPITHTILNGDSHTGVSVMRIRPNRFDVGPLLAQKSLAVPPDVSTPELTGLLAEEGAQLLLETLANLDRLQENPQLTDQKPMIAHKLSVVHAGVNWRDQTVTHVDRQYRALGHTFSLRSVWKENSVRLQDMVTGTEMEDCGAMSSADETFPESSCVPGQPYYHRHSQTLCVRCKDGWVGFRAVVMKKKMSAAAFHNGYLSDGRGDGQIFSSLDNRLGKYFTSGT